MDLLKLLINFLAFDSWSSPESVMTAICTIIGAITTAVVGVVQAFRSLDRKAGKTCCRFTKKPLKAKKPRTLK